METDSRIARALENPAISITGVAIVVLLAVMTSIYAESTALEEHLTFLEETRREEARRADELLQALSAMEAGSDPVREIEGDGLSTTAPITSMQDALVDAARLDQYLEAAHLTRQERVRDLKELIAWYWIVILPLCSVLAAAAAIVGVRKAHRSTSDLERSESELKQSEERLRFILDNSFDMINECDLAGNLVFANERFLTALGHSEEEVFGRPAWEGLHPADYTRLYKDIAAALPTLTPIQATFRIRNHDGEWKWFVATIKPIRAANGEIHLLSFAVDVSEQRTERELITNLMNTMDASGDFIALSDQDYRVFYLNAGGRDLVGVDRDADINGYVAADFFPERLSRPLAKEMEYDLQRVGRFEGESVLQHLKTGEEIPVHIISMALSDADTGELVAYGTVTRDIRSIRRAERQRQQLAELGARNERLASLGLLAGGVAHDFNNLLTSLLMNVGELRSVVESQPESGRRIRRIEDVAAQMTALSKQLLVYAATEQIETEPVDIDALVDNAVGLISDSLPDNVRICRDGEVGREVWLNPGQVTQLITNLVLNAAQAVEHDGGEVRISVDHLEDASIHSALCDLPPRAGVVLEVSDTGCGISPEDEAQIFDPFFSTKRSGTGLGLAVADGVVRSHDGKICVQSAPGEGTTFTAFFPDPESDSKPDGTERIAAHSRPPGAQRAVLVVEDEPSLRETVTHYMKSHGIDAIAVEGARDAISVLRSREQQIGLVLVDFRLPNTNGVRLFESLSRIQPGLHGILCSAEPNLISPDELSSAGFEAFLRKPYRIEKLIDLVTRHLDLSSGAETRC